MQLLVTSANPDRFGRRILPEIQHLVPAPGRNRVELPKNGPAVILH
jgi:hypothetical protein